MKPPALTPGIRAAPSCAHTASGSRKSTWQTALAPSSRWTRLTSPSSPASRSSTSQPATSSPAGRSRRHMATPPRSIGAAGYLDTILERTPFAVQVIRVDGGSEFMADFEDACRERGVKLFVLPPRSPKLNGHIERAQRTHKEEFYWPSTGNARRKEGRVYGIYRTSTPRSRSNPWMVSYSHISTAL